MVTTLERYEALWRASEAQDAARQAQAEQERRLAAEQKQADYRQRMLALLYSYIPADLLHGAWEVQVEPGDRCVLMLTLPELAGAEVLARHERTLVSSYAVAATISAPPAAGDRLILETANVPIESLAPGLPAAEVETVLARLAVGKLAWYRQCAAARRQEEEQKTRWAAAETLARRLADEVLAPEIDAQREADLAQAGWQEGATLTLYRLEWPEGVSEDGEVVRCHAWATSPAPDAGGWWWIVCRNRLSRQQVVSPYGLLVTEVRLERLEDVPGEYTCRANYVGGVRVRVDDRSVGAYAQVTREETMLTNGLLAALGRGPADDGLTWRSWTERVFDAEGRPVAEQPTDRGEDELEL